MSADVYLYTGEETPEDVRLRQEGVIGGVFLVGVGAVPAIGTGTIKVTFVVTGVAATPAIGVPLCKVTFAVSGVAASPSVGSVTFKVTVPVAGVSASPAIGVGTFSSEFALSGVVADAAVGVTQIDVTAMLEGVSATPMIGAGTLEIEGGDVVVMLTGVGADPQVGEGTVTIEEVVVTPPVEELVAGGRRWYGILEDEKVYLTGVAANPQVGSGTLVDLSKLYPFPRLSAIPRPQRRIASLKRAVEPVSSAIPAPETVIVLMSGVKSVSVVGTGTVKRVYDLLDEELIALLEAA